MFVSELRKQKILLAGADALAITMAAIGALALHDPSGGMRQRLLAANPSQAITAWFVVLGAWILIFHWLGLYRRSAPKRREAAAVIEGSAIAVVASVMLFFAMHLEDISRITVALVCPLSIAAVLSIRAMERGAIRHLYSRRNIALPLVIVGFNRLGRYLCDQVLDDPTHYELLGFIDDRATGQSYRGKPVLGNVESLREMARSHPCLEVLIARPQAGVRGQLELIRLCQRLSLRWSLVPWLAESTLSSLQVDMMGTVPVLGPRGSNIEGLNYLIKRAFDLATGAIMLLVALPVMLVAAAAIWMGDGRPILFRQTRIGLHGRHFQMFKFRTMRTQVSDDDHRQYVREWIRAGADASRTDKDGTVRFKLVDDRRITTVGKWLRRFSLDELPQLINVLRGEMSLIGPRPALPYELEHYNPDHRRRFDAPPGVTGLWQVSGRSHLSFEEMIRLDLHYQENWSLSGDIKILLRTMPELLRGGGL